MKRHVKVAEIFQEACELLEGGSSTSAIMIKEKSSENPNNCLTGGLSLILKVPGKGFIPPIHWRYRQLLSFYVATFPFFISTKSGEEIRSEKFPVKIPLFFKL
jgi:hypothetical protein